TFWATLPIVLTAFIKIFGLIFCSFFFVYDNKKQFLIGILFWSLILFYAPALFSSIDFLHQSYKDWHYAVVVKAGIHYDISFIRFLKSVLLFNVNKYYILIGGALMFCFTYLRYHQFHQPVFKQLFLSSILIWMVIFSPSAESPTYIIAVTGTVIWFINSEQKNWQKLLMVFVFIITIMSPSDLFPAFIRKNYVVPYALKALPCAIVWLCTLYEMLFRNFDAQKGKNTALNTSK
ncbi:MAG: hypothetical protein EAZ07_07935, partial [Cytophagales bacterium]